MVEYGILLTDNEGLYVPKQIQTVFTLFCALVSSNRNRSFQKFGKRVLDLWIEGKMNIVLYANRMDEYLKHDSVIDFGNEAIMDQLAFTVRPEMGEEDSFILYPYPDINVLEKLRKRRTEHLD